MKRVNVARESKVSNVFRYVFRCATAVAETLRVKSIQTAITFRLRWETMSTDMLCCHTSPRFVFDY